MEAPNDADREGLLERARGAFWYGLGTPEEPVPMENFLVTPSAYRLIGPLGYMYFFFSFKLEVYINSEHRS